MPTHGRVPGRMCWGLSAVDADAELDAELSEPERPGDPAGGGRTCPPLRKTPALQCVPRRGRRRDARQSAPPHSFGGEDRQVCRRAEPILVASRRRDLTLVTHHEGGRRDLADPALPGLVEWDTGDQARDLIVIGR